VRRRGVLVSLRATVSRMFRSPPHSMCGSLWTCMSLHPRSDHDPSSAGPSRSGSRSECALAK
jgi:hypothetical protein